MSAEQPKTLAEALRMLHGQKLPREVLDDIARLEGEHPRIEGG
jgi:hypothetical protein